MALLTEGVCRTGCGRPGRHYRKTMCHACYEAERRRNGMRPITEEEMFFRRVFGEDENGCWIWGGATATGYGLFCYNYTKVMAHRWAYEFLRTEIPEGLVIDHLCRVPRCVNPWHLEPVTLGVNSLRGEAPMVVVNRTGICPRGHSMADAIVLQSGPQKGRRNCRTCTRNRWRERYKRDPEMRAKHRARAREQKARRAAV